MNFFTLKASLHWSHTFVRLYITNVINIEIHHVFDCLLFKKKYTLILFCLFFLLTGQVCAGELPKFNNTVSLMAKNQDIKLFLKNLFSLTSYPVNISDNIDGLVNHTFVDQPVNMIFSKVSQLHSLVAYYDGAKIYVYNNQVVLKCFTSNMLGLRIWFCIWGDEKSLFLVLLLR